MIPATSFNDQRVAVFGLGGSGRATAAALIAGGADVVAWDDSPDRVGDAEADGIPVADLRDADWAGFTALLLAPGVPLTHPAPHWTVGRARAAGVEVIGDIEVFCRERRRHVPDAPFVAITGTNGKSTTTALIGHLLAVAGRDAQVGGNIGTPVLALEPPATGRFHVIEVSSYQIDLAPSLDPSIGVLLNITPDHLDRHGTFARYAAIKERLVAAADIAIIGVDEGPTQAIADRLERSGRKVIRVSARRPLAEGYFVEGVTLRRADAAASEDVAPIAGTPALRGVHNGENAAAAVATAETLGLSGADIRKGLVSFRGLHHRMEEVGRLGRVLFVNDSKATNADAAAKALASFDRIYWIAGGRAKEGGIAELASFFPRIVKAYLIGEAMDVFAETLDGEVPFERSGTLVAAVGQAARDASADRATEPVVLLSPACASFDQFDNFERRGDAFRSAALSLDGVEAREEAA
ncbi:UDP-N-acetylmuramoyl-L-alanine--D-glutamate ligase [Bauldia sp.]|uniref:UDP-N-acetylmuramoyl-L-alanine--D-glutamate ligase n=1 Tax=Bauldia sp. TaxID=2575872 RepID=UPI003BA94B72